MIDRRAGADRRSPESELEWLRIVIKRAVDAKATEEVIVGGFLPDKQEIAREVYLEVTGQKEAPKPCPACGSRAA